MQATLNTIIDRAREARAAGESKLNPFPTGTLRSVAYEIGFAEDGCAIISTRVDDQVFAVAEVEDGQYQSVVPEDLAATGEGYVHTSLEDAVDYVRDLAASHAVLVPRAA